MKRVLGAAVALVLVVGLAVTGAVWTRGHNCQSVSYSVNGAPGSGSATAQGAIDVFLADFSTLALPHDGWTEQDPSHYANGSAVVEIFRLSDGEYVVTGARTC
jgi:hypothetical protein